MSLKKCILSLLHKTSKNGFVFLYILWGCSKINTVTKVYLNFHQMNERPAEHVQGALFYWEWSKRKKREREREKFKYLGESHRTRKCSAKPSVYPMIFVFNWSKIALQCCVSLYNVVNQLYIVCVCVCIILCICIYPLPIGPSSQPPSPQSRSSQSTKLSSLCCTAVSH